ncbi:hypothetical protein IMSAGC002_02279 [Lachnospiraceae bacterium]|mgnify:CR=1 FL=1|nr:hypothetical protein [Lachnospiraceae bacterium]GFH91027.1 hypothetical protein IMSAGC002_02279 [Lachnospiraceae bacterium]
MSYTDSKKICKNIFKNGESTTSKDNFTKAWIHLINQLEKNNGCQSSLAIPVFNNKSVEGKR